MKAELLKSFEELGFTAHEARAYVNLLTHGRQTGYELARQAQIPRPNIYPILGRLEKRGIVSAVRDGQRTLYTALPASQMAAKITKHYSAQATHIEYELKTLQPPPSADLAWNIEGKETVLAKANDLLQRASSRLLVGLWSMEAGELADSMANAQSRGAELSVLCIQGCERECGGCQGQIFRYPVVASGRSRWLVISADDREILLAQFLSDESARGIHSTLDVLVSVGGHYLRNAIAVSEIFRCGGQDLLKSMDAHALEAIQGTGLATGDKSWLDQILEAVSQNSKNKQGG